MILSEVILTGEKENSKIVQSWNFLFLGKSFFSRSPKVFRTRDVSITLDHTRTQKPSFWWSQGSSSKLVVVLHTAPRLVTYENHISSLAQLRVS